MTERKLTGAAAKAAQKKADKIAAENGGVVVPSQVDRHSPMNDGESPSRLEHAILEGRVQSLEQLVRKLLTVLPIHEQAEFIHLLPEVQPDASES